MNTERPDNDDTGASAEASGGGDGSAAEALGAGAEEERGAEVSGAEGTSAEGPGDEEPGRAETPPAEEVGAAETESPAEADQDGDGAAEASGGSGDSATDDEGIADADTDDSPPSGASGTTAAAAAADSDELLVPDSEVRRDEGADDLRSARRRSPLAVAAVAAAVLLVGGGGAYLAADTSGGSGKDTTSGASGDDTPPPLALDGYSAGGGTGNGIAPGEPNPYGVTYRVDGSLPKGPASAPVYRAGGQIGKDDVSRLAEALGVDGTPAVRGQVWRVGVTDGSGPVLTVNRQAPGAWTFQRYSPVIDNCKSTTVCGAQPDTAAGDPVSEAAAEKAAAPVLKAVGQADAKLDASQVMGAQRVVNADPVVGGLPTYGWSTGVTVNAQGEVVGGTGQLAAPAKSDTYPVLSAEKTLGLLNKVPSADPRMGIGGCASPVPLKDRLEAPCGESTASPAAGSSLTVEKAVFGLASQLVDGRQALVPSWLFEVRAAGAQDAFTVTYPAVDPTYIASPATVTPSAPATPTAPSGEPTSAPKTRDVKVDGYTADGDQLTVNFTGGVCGDYAASASESSGKVTVTVTETPWQGKVCIMIAKEIQKTVILDEPLGDREVVGSDGKAIPLQKAGARLPETSGAR
ncbi:hypothetical protein [Streptomyces sp. NPDC005374]|uniref:hypothetical protein n=1 Tax=Streptomyces sp. NPDC005374 TaxID=3364713 RepID=UPI003680D346